MPNSAPKLIALDACVLLSYVDGDEDRLPVIDEIFHLQRSGDIRLITSIVSRVEVAFDHASKDAGELSEEADQAIEELWLPGSPVEVIELSDTVAIAAREAIRFAMERNRSLKANDSIHLATAAHFQAAELHTYDEKLHKFDNYLGLRICEPYVEQPPLGMEQRP